MMIRVMAGIHKLRILPLFMIAGSGLLVSKIYDVAGALTQPSGLIARAQAQEVPAPDTPVATGPASEKAVTPGAAQDDAPAIPTAQDLMNLPPEQVAVLRALNARPPKTDDQENAGGQENLQIKAIEQRVDQKLGRMQEIQTHLKQLVTQREDSEKKDARKLVTMYEKMKPKEAARILEGIDMETLVQLLSQFHETKASAILASMSPEKARVATVWLMHRRQADGFNADIPAPAPAPAKIR